MGRHVEEGMFVLIIYMVGTDGFGLAMNMISAACASGKLIA